MTINIVSFIIVLILIITVFQSIRTGKLDTKYSILWVVTCLVIGFLSLNEQLINYLGKLLNVDYPPSILFLFGLLFIILILFDLTKRISQLNHNVIIISQKLALMEEKYIESRKI
jgi:hypothetical protein